MDLIEMFAALQKAKAKYEEKGIPVFKKIGRNIEYLINKELSRRNLL